MTYADYSTAALNVLHKFNNVDAVIFVEGDPDTVFWKNISIILNTNNVLFIPTGGSLVLDKLIEKIENEDAKIIVARDSDHLPFCTNQIKHIRVIYTHGYSIENYLYCPESLNLFIQNTTSKLESKLNLIEDWCKQISNKLTDILIYDIANMRFQKGTSIFGETCSRFLCNHNPPEISMDLINKFIKSLEGVFSRDDLMEVQSLLNADHRDRYWLIKGHFLTNAIILYLRYLYLNIKNKKNVSISKDHLFTGTINNCRLCSKQTTCAPFQSIINNFSKAILNIVSK